MSTTTTLAILAAAALGEAVPTGEPTPPANRDLAATGLANLGGALLGSMPAGGGTSQTAVNRPAEARTQVGALVTAAGALLSMLVLAPYIGLMPQATLAAAAAEDVSGRLPERGRDKALPSLSLTAAAVPVTADAATRTAQATRNHARQSARPLPTATGVLIHRSENPHRNGLGTVWPCQPTD